MAVVRPARSVDIHRLAQLRWLVVVRAIERGGGRCCRRGGCGRVHPARLGLCHQSRRARCRRQLRPVGAVVRPPDVDNCTFTNNSGLSTFRALQNVDFTCRRGQWTPSTGAFDELAATTATGHYEGCFFVCARGYYGESTRRPRPRAGSCPRGHYCDEARSREPCPLGTHAPTEGASSRRHASNARPARLARAGNGNARAPVPRRLVHRGPRPVDLQALPAGWLLPVGGRRLAHDVGAVPVWALLT